MGEAPSTWAVLPHPGIGVITLAGGCRYPGLRVGDCLFVSVSQCSPCLSQRAQRQLLPPSCAILLSDLVFAWAFHLRTSHRLQDKVLPTSSARWLTQVWDRDWRDRASSASYSQQCRSCGEMTESCTPSISWLPVSPRQLSSAIRESGSCLLSSSFSWHKHFLLLILLKRLKQYELSQISLDFMQSNAGILMWTISRIFASKFLRIYNLK